MNEYIMVGVFTALILGIVVGGESRRALFSKPWSDWVLDGTGLFVQGTLIPWLQTGVLFLLYVELFGAFRGVLELSTELCFALNLVVVDYLYYWNHRLLHTKKLWPIHLVHHTMTQMDVFGTSRNTIWSSFFIVYIWVNSAVLFLLADPVPYLGAITATACLDLWRHSNFFLAREHVLARVLSVFLVTPHIHAVHHGEDAESGNYGANFTLWDRLHGSFKSPESKPVRLGVESNLTLIQKLVWPF